MTDYQPPANGWRTFLIVWITQSLSVVGSALTFFAINIWLVQTLYPRPEQKPQLAFALSAMTLAFAIPTVFGAPIAGAWADRHDRKLTMLLSDVGSGVVSFTLLIMVATGTLQLWSLIALFVLFAICEAFHNASFDTSYVMLVTPVQLPRANGMMQTVFSLSGIFSPPLAAILIGLPALARQGELPQVVSGSLARIQDGTVLAISVDILTFVIAVVTLFLVRIPSPKRADLADDSGKPKPSLLADVREGARYIWRRKALLWLLGTFTVANFAGAPMGVLQPLLVRFDLAADWAARGFTFETAMALLGSVSGVGGVIGGFIMSTWGGLKRRRVYGVLIPMIVSGAATVMLGFSSSLYVAAAMIGATIGLIPIMNAHSQAIWQTQVPPELQGRVFSVRRVIAQFTFPLGTALSGVAAGLLSPGTVFIVVGSILALFCVGQLFNPYLLRVEDKQWLDQQAAGEPEAAQPSV